MQFLMERPARKYECVVIMHPDASEDQQKALFRKNKEIIKSFEGEVNHLDTWGKRKLGNPINKLKMGIYFHTTFEAKGEAISELERTMRLNDKVLRFTHSRLDDREPISKHLQKYREVMELSRGREQEREAKAQARRAARERRPARG
jgi:small subunit ribosomal protein S6